MGEQLTVRPAEGRTVRDPQTRAALPPDEWSSVPRSPYWIRRLRDGDVLEQQQPREAAAAPRSARAAREKE